MKRIIVSNMSFGGDSRKSDMHLHQVVVVAVVVVVVEALGLIDPGVSTLQFSAGTSFW